MITYAKFAGLKCGITPKAKMEYADVLINYLFDDGEPDIEQSKIRVYDPSIIAQCKLIKAGQNISLELVSRDVSIKSVTVVEDE